MGHIAGFMDTVSLGAFIQTESMFSCIRKCTLGMHLQDQLDDTALRERSQAMQIRSGIAYMRSPWQIICKIEKHPPNY